MFGLKYKMNIFGVCVPVEIINTIIKLQYFAMIMGALCICLEIGWKMSNGPN